MGSRLDPHDHMKPGFWDEEVARQHARDRRRLLAVGECVGKAFAEAGEQHVGNGSPTATAGFGLALNRGDHLAPHSGVMKSDGLKDGVHCDLEGVGLVFEKLNVALQLIRHEFLRRLIGPSDGRSHPGPSEAPSSPGRGVPMRLWRRVRALHDWLNDCWIGDLIGVLALFAGLFLFLIIGGVL